MMERLFRDVLIAGFEAGVKRRPVFRYLKSLERTQWLPPEDIRSLQLEALQRLLRHAMEYCPYYREHWLSMGLDPRSLPSLDDFNRWPIIERATVRENRMAMRSQAAGLRLIAKATGGSSGDPLQFDLDTDSNERRMAAWHRGYGWAGAGPGTKQTYLWGTALVGAPRWRRVKNRLYEALYRRDVLSSFALSDQTAGDFLRRINRRRPEVIVAYTNPLYSLARIIDERGLHVHSPRSIVVGAEALHDFQRKLIEKVFRAPVFETYGSREFMLLGAECDRHQGLHLTAEHILVEVVDEQGLPVVPGAEGRVVVTDLYNYGMPFIRYANGDRALAGTGTCSCGRGLPLLGRVLGRQLDVLVTPDGRRVPGELFPHLLKDFPEVRRFQVVQENPGRIEMRLVVNGVAQDLERRIETALRPAIGNAVQFQIIRVQDVPLTRAGKLQVVVSCIPSSAEADPAAVV